jgi:hypothetical protein
MIPTRTLRFLERCAFLFYKARASVGTSIHNAMVRLATLLYRIHTDPRAIEGDQLRPLKSLEGTAPTGWAQNLGDVLGQLNYSEYRTVVAGKTNGVPIAQLATSYEHLYPLALALMDTMREETLIQLRLQGTDLRRSLDGNEKKVLLITFGFSKMVREVIRNYFAEELAKDNDLHKRTTVVILDIKNRTDEAIRMKYMCSENKNGTSQSGYEPIKDLIVTNVDFAKGLLAPGCTALVLMGADTFQQENDHEGARVLRTNTGQEDLLDLKAAVLAKKGQFVLVSVAESYKCVPDLVGKEQLPSDHYSNSSLYEGLEMRIITDGLAERVLKKVKTT